jgi:hypothetical protein
VKRTPFFFVTGCRRNERIDDGKKREEENVRRAGKKREKRKRLSRKINYWSWKGGWGGGGWTGEKEETQSTEGELPW